MNRPTGVRLVSRVGIDREMPLARPLLSCDTCRAWTTHVRGNMMAESDAVSFVCDTCRTPRRWGH